MKERMFNLRKKLGLGQEEFGRRIGITRSSVSGFESGRRNPSDQTIISICREFNVNETWLRTGEGEMFVEMELEDELMQWAGTVLASKPDDFRKRFVRMLSRLSENEWELLTKMAQELTDGTDKNQEDF